MLLGNAQKKALALLKEYGCLREEQLEQLLKPGVEHLNMSAIKRQLAYYGLIESDSAFLKLPGCEVNQGLIEAVDIMLSFSVSDIQVHKSAPEPFLLTFFKDNKDGKLCRYDICHCNPGNERILSAGLEGLNQKYRTTLILLADINQRQMLNINSDHCFVVRENEKYKFYKPALKPENGETQ